MPNPRTAATAANPAQPLRKSRLFIAHHSAYANCNDLAANPTLLADAYPS
jgi:hypothetical protein